MNLSADLTTIALLQALAGLNMNDPLEHRSILDMTTINDVPGEKYVRRDGSLILKFGNPVEGPHEQFDFHGSESLADRIVTAVNAFEANQARIAELSKALKNATDALTYCHRGMVDDPLEPKVAVTLKKSRAALSIPS